MIEEKFSSDEFLSNVRKMDEDAQIHLDNESLELILVGHAFSTVSEASHIFRVIDDSDRGIDGEIEFKNDQGHPSGQRVYLRLRAVDSFWRGRRHTDADYQSYAKLWQASDVPIMMVFRTAEEKIHWMNLTEYVKRYGTESGLTNFESEAFTALNVNKIGQELTASVS